MPYQRQIKENLFYASLKIAGIHFKIFSSHKGVKKIFMNKKDGMIKSGIVTKLYHDDPLMFNIFNELTEYFEHKRKKFTVPLDITGTEFEKKVWGELKKIPYGKTVSYKLIAQKAGNIKAFRAVGRIIGLNPVPIIIPCHRVINYNGNIGGYGCGIKIKQKILEHEGSLSMELFE
jgi:methylated-DNA-[protein]-cysteine S-methyltransferase